MLSAGRLAGRRATALAAAAAATALLVAPVVGSEPAAATTAPAAEGPTLTIAPTDPLLSEGEELELELRLENPGDAVLPASTVEVLLTSSPIGTRYGLSRWFEGQALFASAPVAQVEVPAAAAGDAATATVTIDAEALGLDGRQWGAYGIGATDGSLAMATSVVVRDEPGESSPTRLALAAPIDSGATEGLLDADDLERTTALGGQAREALDAAIDAGATIGADPLLAASAAALGEDAPQAAEAWLERVDRPETYPLQFGNADPIAQVRAGAYPVEPIGIPRDDAPMLPPGAAAIGTRQPVIDATAAVLTADDLRGLGTAGTVVLTTANLDELLVGSTPSAHARVEGVDVVAADAELQSLVRAAGRDEGVAASDSRARALGLLATVTRERPSDPRTLAAMLPASSTGDVAALLADLDDATFVETVGIDAALDAPVRDAVLAADDDPQRDAGAQLVRAALDQEAEAAQVASIVDDPSTLLAGLRLDLLLALPDAGRSVTEADRVAIDGVAGALADIRHAVRIVGGSDIQAVGTSLPLPITLTNELEVETTVVLTVRPSNALVTVPDPEVEVTVAPGSQQRVQVPIEIVGAGTVLMIAQLQTPDGVSLGQIQTVRVAARPTIEAVVAWTLGIGIALLLGFGVWRSVRKRRSGEARGDLDDRTTRRRTEPNPIIEETA
ncbi:DUF6049 family protein [Agrococcus terreus]|uniref:Uncharacterized protein n=1 Tax=Agrococcus terreus TaxID=574649 RepID=A0ABQ2K9W0_9MICO|nr:DUF6049 family protein [Agrococcus terreus]GGN77229.1 hypothetical protein GCM10010968_01490 [Agrococcus terreus]